MPEQRLDLVAVTALALSADLRERLLRAARAAAPREACGVLLGTRGSGELRVASVRTCRNLAREPARFELDPVEHLAAEREAEALGLDVLGAWHSHVDAPAQPSRLDRAAPLGDVLLIVSLAAANVEWRAWNARSAAGPPLELVLREPAPCAAARALAGAAVPGAPRDLHAGTDAGTRRRTRAAARPGPSRGANGPTERPRLAR